MHTEQPRHASGAVIFVSLVAMIVIGIGTIAFAVMSATGESQSQSSSTSQTTVDQTHGLELSLLVSPGIGPSGTDFVVNASVTNVLPAINNVTGLDDYNGVGTNPVCKFAPIAFDVLQGHYTLANFTSGNAIDVHGPQVYMCVIGAADLSYYVFQPNSDNFTGSPAIGQSRTAQISVDVSQVWSDGPTAKAPLPAGEYTVVAADNWGQLAIAYFTVS